MSDEENDIPESTPDETATAIAVAEAGDEAPYKMTQTVVIENAGPCKKHVRVVVPRADLDHFYNTVVKELVGNAAVPGFRAGHVPRKLIEKRFKKEVTEQVRQKALTQSLQQLGEDHKLDAINEPDLDVEGLELPDVGDFTYEFDVEVRPEFDLPNYAGLKVNRPDRKITDDDVERYLEKYLERSGRLVPHDGPAEVGDFVLADLHFESAGKPLGHASDQKIRIRPVLRFTDAEVSGFDKLMTGAISGDTRTAKASISSEATQQELRGEPVEITFKISDVQRLRLPELAEFLEEVSVESEEALRKGIREALERQVTYEQRQVARRQVLEQITASADWDLPESLVSRQVENALRREVLEMQQAGFTDEQIRARQNELLQRQISTTRQALKEHFVLDKIATQEKIEVSPEDKETEIYFMAQQRGESPRKVRARLEKTGMIENLDAQILERKAVDVVLSQAKFVDVPGEPQPADNIEAVDLSVCGQSVASPPQTAPTAE
ncbi:MAG: trigger factor [Planctomycetaceae bacterium]|nr:trigger factor [Planctomycetaceae bacterium]